MEGIMMKMKFPTLLAILMASASMTACVEEPMEDEVQTTQKDAYSTLDSCLEDWGDKELCTKAMEASIAQQQAQQQQAQANGGDTTVIAPLIFYGPEYSSGQRSAYNSKGQAIFPKGNHATKTTPPLKPSNTYMTRRQNSLAHIESSSRSSGSKSSFFGSSGSRSGAIGGSHSFSGGG